MVCVSAEREDMVCILRELVCLRDNPLVNLVVFAGAQPGVVPRQVPNASLNARGGDAADETHVLQVGVVINLYVAVTVGTRYLKGCPLRKDMWKNIN